MDIKFFTQLLSGNDVFISYRWQESAKSYALKLAEELEKRGLDCFIDEKTLARGESIPSSITRAIRRSRMFVLLVTDDITESEWIPEELRLASSHGRKVVPLNVNKALNRIPLDKAPWNVLRDISRVEEDADAIEAGIPSKHIAAQLDQSYNFTRQRVKTIRGLFLAGLIFFAVSLAAIGSAVYAVRIREQAQAETARLTEQAERLKTEAAQAIEAKARADADKQKALGDKQRAEKDRDTAQNEAVAQTEIAAQQRQEAVKQKNLADSNEARGRRFLYGAHMTQAQQALSVGNINLADNLLGMYLPAASKDELRGFEWHYLWRSFHRESVNYVHSEPVEHVVVSSDGKLLATVYDGKERYGPAIVEVKNLSTNENILTLTQPGSVPPPVAFSPDGKTLAVVGKPIPISSAEGEDESLALPRRHDSVVELWDIEKRQKRDSIRLPYDSINDLLFFPKRNLLVVQLGGGFNSRVHIWDIDVMKQWQALEVSGNSKLAISADGRFLATTDSYGVDVWDFEKKRMVAELDRGLRLEDSMIGSIRLLRVKSSHEREGEGQEESAEAGDQAPSEALDRGDDINPFDAARPDERSPYGRSDEQRAAADPSNNDPIMTIAFSSDNKTLAVGYMEGGVKLLDVTTLTKIADLEGHRDSINAGSFPSVSSMAFSPDGKMLATGSQDMSVKLWDLSTRAAITTFRGFQGSVTSVAFSPDGKTVVAGAFDGAVKLWSIQSEPISLPQYTNPNTQTAAFTPDSSGIAMILSNSTKIKLWDVATQQEVVTVNVGPSAPHVFSFLPKKDRKVLAVGTYDGTVELWDLMKKEKLAQFSGLKGFTSYALTGLVWAVAFSPDGKSLAASADGIMRVWDIETKKELFSRKQGAMELAFSPNNRLLAVGGYGSQVELYHVGAWQKIRTIGNDKANNFWSMAFSSDGKILATSGDAGTKLWDVETGKELATLRGHAQGIRSIVFSSDGKSFATCSNDGTAKIWSASTLQEVITLQVDKRPVAFITFSPDGKTLATVGDYTIKLWPAATNEGSLLARRN